MAIKKNILTVLIMFLFVLFVNSQDKEKKIDFNLMLDFYSHPFFYESTNKLYGNSLNGSVFMGAEYKQFIWGAEVTEEYVSFISMNDSTNYNGAWNILSGNLVLFYSPIKFLRLKSGLGGSYFRSAFFTEDVGTFGKDEGGLSFLFNAEIKHPFEYLEVKLKNKINLFFKENKVSPYYYGAINLSVHPYFKWISLYNEVGILTIVYNDIPRNINSACFVWSTGISFDLSFPSIANYTKEKIKQKNIKDLAVSDKLIETDKTQIEESKKAADEKPVTFDNIFFQPDTYIIKAEYYQILDNIAEVLKQKENISIEIIGHTNDLGKPRMELELSKKRSEAVKKYLNSRGIDASRMKTTGVGSAFSKNKNIDDANRKVEIITIYNN